MGNRPDDQREARQEAEEHQNTSAVRRADPPPDAQKATKKSCDALGEDQTPGQQGSLALART